MLRKISAAIILLAGAGAVAGYGQSTDPKASDQTGNGPPAVVITPRNQDGSTGDSKDDKKKAALERPISGVVTDADGKLVAGAVVQLKNTRTLQIRSFITRDKGEYYFAGLSKDVDYEVKAQFSGHLSPPHTLSSFDTRPLPVINLQLK
jgi:hypothetical protein